MNIIRRALNWIYKQGTLRYVPDDDADPKFVKALYNWKYKTNN